MSDSKRVTPSKPEPPAPAGTGGGAARELTSGRVAFDSRGNAVWEWRSNDGQFARDVSTTLVQKLEEPALELEPTVIIKQPDTATASESKLQCGGFDPYDRGNVEKAAPPRAQPPKLVFPPVKPAIAPPQKSEGLLQRLKSLKPTRGPSGGR